jgi:hypothetical protein
MKLSHTSLQRASPLTFGFIAFVLAITALVTNVNVWAQESSSRPGDASKNPASLPSMPTVKNADDTTTPPLAASGPAAALRDVLQAACSQNAGDFSRYLTARSKESF